VRVLVLTPYLYGTAAGPRSSFELWEQVLARAGIELHYAAFESERLHEIIYEPGRNAEKALEMARCYRRLIGRARHGGGYDAVLVNREAALIGPALVEEALARSGVPLVYLLDDPMYIRYRSPVNGRLSYLKCFSKFGRLCGMATVVIANSRGNREFAAARNGNVWEIPSVVDGARYDGFRGGGGAGDGGAEGVAGGRRAAGDRVGVGWTGSATTSPNLAMIAEPLRRLAKRSHVRLSLIGARRLEPLGLQAHVVPWRAETEIDDLRALDVGLLPVPPSPWEPNKFYLKLIQYMALGIVPVASPAGDNARVIEHGVHGFLVESPREWIDTVDRLIADPALRARIGRAAAARAAERYTLQANAERIVGAFRSALR
jgi:glycosyltransferase involved in cell wall biosynthesis